MIIYNTLTRKKEGFIPQGDTVTMYICGVTVYNDCHIGHAMSYIIFDAIRRYLEYKGYKIKHVQNFTDIDDKIINRANQLHTTAGELSEKYINEYFKDMDALNIKRAHVYPKATEEIPKIIEVINGLIDKGYAYQSQGSVYFRVNRFATYGKLSNQNINEMISKTSIDEANKENPLDFAIWKSAKKGEPFWASPWGKGRPGWHIECSAMALKHLGETIDIHGGGMDLIFPHHENEITQTESYTGNDQCVKFWLHNGLLQLSGDKMSKSLGNLVTIKDCLSRFSPDAIRLFILSSYYRNPLTFSETSIAASESGIDRLKQAIISVDEVNTNHSALNDEPYKKKFIDSMDDDFNTAEAISTLFDLARDINRNKEKHINVQKAQKTLLELANVLGFTLQDFRQLPLEAEQIVNLLVSVRNDLRQAKQWELSDKIRNGLAQFGIILEDKSGSTTWKRIR